MPIDHLTGKVIESGSRTVSNQGDTYSSVTRAVLDEIIQLRELRKMTSKNRTLFCIDLTMIALSIRTGYLLDVIAVENPTKIFPLLLQNIRKVCPVFEKVCHLYEPASGQSFFVNIPMLQHKITAHISATDNRYPISFVRLLMEDDFELLPESPKDLMDVLQSLKNDLTAQSNQPTSVHLPTNLPPTTAIPLAGFILEYPVAYVPGTPDQTTFLNRVPLDVYECVVAFNPSHLGHIDRSLAKHTLLKFSYPSLLAQTYPRPFSPSNMIATLMARFNTHITQIIADSTVNVLHTSEILERVAL